MHRGEVCVTSEWAALREVVVGRAFYRIPNPVAASRRKGVSEALWEKVNAYAGMTMEAAMPTEHARCAAQIEAVAREIEARGVIVHRVPPFELIEEAFLAAEASEAMQFFPRDPVLVAGKRVIELSMRDVRRRRERGPLGRLLRERLGDAGVALSTMPFPQPPHAVSDPFAFIEGGDCLVNADEVLVGVRAGGSNAEGVAWLRRALEGSHRVTPVALAPGFAHLDLALGLVRQGLGIACRAGLPEGLPPSLRDWEWIEISDEEALQGMAANGLPLNAHVLILPDTAVHTADALDRRGHEVLRVPFQHITRFRGGLRCWTQPLVRKDDAGA